MIRKTYDTVTEAMTDLKKLGYTKDFSILTDQECLVCHLSGTVLSPDEFEIDDFYIFEGNSDQGDEMIVYAISSKNENLKGIVVNAYGIYSDNGASGIVKKFTSHPKQNPLDIIENITQYFKVPKNEEQGTSPEGTCPVCWGRQEYDGKIRTMLKDKQIDVNNHKDSYMLIQDFVKHHIDGATLLEGIVTDCPDCSTENIKIDKQMTIKKIKEELNSADSPVAKSLHHGTGFKVLLMGFKKGMILIEHKAHVKSKLTVLEGAVIYKEESRVVELGQYDEVKIPVEITHSVEAIEDSLCILSQGAS